MLLWDDKKKIFDLHQNNYSSRKISAVRILEKSIQKITKIAPELSASSLWAAGENQSPVNFTTEKNRNWTFFFDHNFWPNTYG